MASQSSKQKDHAPLYFITCLQNRPLSNPLYIYGASAFHLQFYPHIICNNIFTINCFKHQENLYSFGWSQKWIIARFKRQCRSKEFRCFKRTSFSWIELYPGLHQWVVLHVSITTEAQKVVFLLNGKCNRGLPKNLQKKKFFHLLALLRQWSA